MPFKLSILVPPALMLAFSAVHMGCNGKDPVYPDASRSGSLSLRIRVEAASPFKTIAKRGDITVTAKDMAPITSALILGESTVEGTVTGIPTGPDRKIEVKVYDSAGAVRYLGSAAANVIADSSVAVSVTLVRKTGSIAVDGTISEPDTARPPLSTPWASGRMIAVGAQSHVALGSVVDLDEVSAWTSSQANANQAGIDLVFLFYSGAFHLHNAVQAKAVGVAHDINLTTSYDPARIKDIRIVKIAAKPADQETARKAFADGTLIMGTLIRAGDMLLAESGGGKLALVTVKAISGTTSAGTADLDINLLTLP